MYADIFVGAKHSGSKSLVIINKLSAKMLRLYKIEMHPPEKPGLLGFDAFMTDYLT